jgi:hypothetical protein
METLLIKHTTKEASAVLGLCEVIDNNPDISLFQLYKLLPRFSDGDPNFEDSLFEIGSAHLTEAIRSARRNREGNGVEIKDNLVPASDFEQ